MKRWLYQTSTHIFFGIVCTYLAWWYIASNIDTSPMFGPGGVKSITALWENYPQRDWGTWLMQFSLDRYDQNAEQAARSTVLIGHMLTVFGVGLCAFRLGGFAMLRATCLLCMCFSPLLWNAILLGPDAIATGVAWLGVGIAWISTMFSIVFAIPLAMLGAFLCIFAAKIKITALPCAIFLGVLPFLSMKPMEKKSNWFHKLWNVLLRSVCISSCCLGVLLYLKNNWMPRTDAHVKTTSTITTSVLEHGYHQLQTVFDENSVVVQIGYIAIVGMILPGKHWFTRMSLGIFTAIALCYTASTLGDKIRPRYFAPSEVPLLILTGCALLRYSWMKYIGQIAALVISVSLYMDSIAYHSKWSDFMSSLSGTDKHSLTKVPDGWLYRYTKFSRLDHDDHSAVGSKRLHELAKDHAKQYVLGLPLRDGREHHLSASAGAGGHSSLILTPKFCCSHQPNIEICAKQTMESALQSDTRLILPIIHSDRVRLPQDVYRWYVLLYKEAKQYSSWQEEAHWGYIEGVGTQKPPCDRPPRGTKGFWEIDGEKPNAPQGPPNRNNKPPK